MQNRLATIKNRIIKTLNWVTHVFGSILTAPMKFYYLTWIMVLVYKEKRIPVWLSNHFLQKDSEKPNVIPEDPEKYER